MLRFQVRLSLTRILVGLGLIFGSFATAVSPAAAAQVCQPGTTCLLPVPSAAPLAVAPAVEPVVVDDVDDGKGSSWLLIGLLVLAAAAALYFFVLDDDDPVSP